MMERRDDGPRVRPRELFCRRTGEVVDLAEHERCPYCFGRMATIEQGAHEAFCDYDPARDPLQFGFPPDSLRHRSG